MNSTSNCFGFNINLLADILTMENKSAKMKPKTIDEVLNALVNCYSSDPGFPVFILDKIESKQQLIELFMSCVHDSCEDCRDQMIKNLEKLK